MADLNRKSMIAIYIFAVAAAMLAVTFKTSARSASVRENRVALSAQCMTTIVQTTYRLYAYTPNFSFVVDSHIQSCQNIQSNSRELLAAR